MATWNSRGLRGSALEELINKSNERYLDADLALIQKIPTPITPVEISAESRQITLAYFEKKSTVDYIGVVQGIPLCFEAKECRGNVFPLQNIHEHQIRFMEEFERQGGVAFLLIFFADEDRFCYLPFIELKKFWDRGMAGGRKSFRSDEMDESFFFEGSKAVPVPYLDMLQCDLDTRSECAKQDALAATD